MTVNECIIAKLEDVVKLGAIPACVILGYKEYEEFLESLKTLLTSDLISLEQKAELIDIMNGSHPNKSLTKQLCFGLPIVIVPYKKFIEIGIDYEGACKIGTLTEQIEPVISSKVIDLIQWKKRYKPRKWKR